MCVALDRVPIPNLEYELEEAKKTKDWFNAINYSAIQLEKYGYIAIRNISTLNELSQKS